MGRTPCNEYIGLCALGADERREIILKSGKLAVSGRPKLPSTVGYHVLFFPEKLFNSTKFRIRFKRS